MIYIILSITIAVLVYNLYTTIKEKNALEPILYKYNTLKDDYEELKEAYDNIINKYYKLHDDCLDLEKKIDEFEEKELNKEFEKSINETELRANQEE